MIKDLKDGISGSGTYICKAMNKGIGSNGSIFLTITLQDASGIIDAKKWTYEEEDDELFKSGNILHIDADCVSFKDKLQLKIKRASLMSIEDCEMSELVAESSFSLEDLTSKLNRFVSNMSNENIKKIVIAVLKEYQNAFMSYPAAVSNHHDYLRGLFEHSISMAEIGEFVANHYSSVNKDYLIAGALLHDVGKVIELSGVIGTKYTTKGDLLGHLVIGENIIQETAKKLGIEGEEVTILSHLVLSHHGDPEYGACVYPLTREALLLSMIDDMDAKMKVLDKAFKNTQKGEFSDRIFALGNRAFYKIED